MNKKISEIINKNFYEFWKVIKSNVGLEGKYEKIKKVMEEAPNGVDIKPMSKFRKDTRIEKY